MVNSTWAEKFLGTIVARAEVHSTVSVVRPVLRISRRVNSAGIMTGSPDGTKSSQWLSVADFALAAGVVFGADETEDCQQKCVLWSSEAKAGTESMEMKDCCGAGPFVGSEGTASPKETR